MPFNVPSISDIIVVVPCKLKQDQDEERLSLIKGLAHWTCLLFTWENSPDLLKRAVHKSELVYEDY